MHPSELPRSARLAGPIGLTALTLIGIAALSCVGLPDGIARHLGLISVVMDALSTGPLALAYLLGAFGLGRPFARLLASNSPNRLWIQLGLGLGAMLWLSHLLGVLGLLSGPGATPRVAGWGLVGLGLILLADQVVRGPLRPERWPVLPISSILWAPGLALLIVAAANPPGSPGLWRPTEFGAFDALSYHLQLPKEWAAGSRLWPTTHNVYSYLPAFIESAYLHLGALMPGGSSTGASSGGAVAAAASTDPIHRLLGDDGNWVIACQYLHAGIAIIAALLTARAAWVLARRIDADERTSRILAALAGAFTLCTPWTIVVSTLPYNEAGLLALAACAVLIVMDADVAPIPRGAAAGFVVGIACGCKPTALFMVGPLVGLLLLAGTRSSARPRSILTGAITGLIAIAPWLIRNFIASGNPVFPFAARIFGTGHWTAEQVQRHSQNHHPPPGLSITDRLARLFDDEFGLLHTQWGIALFVLVIAIIVSLVWRASHKSAALFSLGLLAQIVCWLFLTHLQSRFLLPLIVPIAMLFTLAGAALVSWVQRSGGEARRPTLAAAALAVLALAPLSQALHSTTLFLKQNDRTPNALLVEGVGLITGQSLEDRLQHPDNPKRAEFIANLDPVQYINLIIRPQENADAGVYLLGESRALYFLAASGADPPARKPHAGSPIVYHTTWDTPFLLPPPQPAGLPSSADGVHAWSRSLRDRDIRYILVNYDELKRLIAENRYFDPSLTLDALARWLTDPASHLRSIRTFRPASAPPTTGAELFEITLPAPSRTSGGAPRP